MLGFFLMPSSTYACETKTEKPCCKKEISSKTEKKDCCEKNKQSNDNQKGCSGKCGHSNCTTSTVNFSLISSSEIEFKSPYFVFNTEKQKFYHNETDISSGFCSVWSPPKIN
jgi:hypothetical protein